MSRSIYDSISVLPKRYRDQLKQAATAEDCAYQLSEYILEIDTNLMLVKNELSYLFGQEKIPSIYKASILRALRQSY
jgi:hypothetical protein